MQTKKAFIMSLALTGFIVAVGGASYAYQNSRQQIDTIAELNKACAHPKDKDGYGNITLNGTNFSHQKGIISTPCKIHLRAGSTLQLNDINLQTKDLVVLDSPKDPKSTNTKLASHVLLNRVTLQGRAANLQINLANPASTLMINDSTIDYEKSLVVGVGDDDADTKAVLTVLRNTMRSTAVDSKGIVLVSTGKATFTDNLFHVNESIGSALLLGDSCEFSNNTNANDRCHGDQEVL